jgi:hypothetical protein
VNTTFNTRWMPLKAAVDASGMSYTTLRRRIRDGSLEAIRSGPVRIYVSVESLHALRKPYVVAPRGTVPRLP